jgi:hypothetical protein
VYIYVYDYNISRLPPRSLLRWFLYLSVLKLPGDVSLTHSVHAPLHPIGVRPLTAARPFARNVVHMCAAPFKFICDLELVRANHDNNNNDNNNNDNNNNFTSNEIHRYRI